MCSNNCSMHAGPEQHRAHLLALLTRASSWWRMNCMNQDDSQKKCKKERRSMLAMCSPKEASSLMMESKLSSGPQSSCAV